MFTSVVDEQRQIIKALSAVNICPRCILRFLGEKEQNAFKEPFELVLKKIKILAEPDDDLRISNLSENAVPVVCGGCLGILQDCCNEEFVEKLSDEVKNSGSQFNSFYCSLNIPLSLIVRQHSIMIYLKDTLRSVYENLNQDDVVSVKEIWKWIAGPQMALFIKSPFDTRSSFEIWISFNHEGEDGDLKFLQDLHPEIFHHRKFKKSGSFPWELYTKPSVLKALSNTTDEKFKRFAYCPPAPVSHVCQCKPVICNHSSLFIAGRYNKYSRTLSQTPWYIDGEKKMETSVQELICDKVIAKFKAVEYRFSASGREDVDVRTLGTGRPFVVELVNPKVINLSKKEMFQLQQEINERTGDIAIRHLQVVNKDEIMKLKEGEADKTKSYSALCWINRPIQLQDLECLKELKDLKLNQKTPIRVLHRRPLAARDRIIHYMVAEWVDEHHFKLKLNTQAGTYIKEFVHGDFGRTEPNLGSLLNAETDILELDVESVDIDWPKQLDCL